MSDLFRPRLVLDSRCALGEGALWHPLRQELLFFDILGRTLYRARGDGAGLRAFPFPGFVSAAGWVDHDRLVVSAETGLILFDMETGDARPLARFPAGTVATRGNDGRADRMGGFWCSTMGLQGERQAGAIFRFADGALTMLRPGVTIPNAIAFSPDGARASFADTAHDQVFLWDLDRATGAPTGEPRLFRDTSGDPGHPDGAVFDAEGFLWCAHWDGWAVVRFAADGSIDRRVSLPVARPTCPAFGGPDMRTLFVTSAREGLSAAELEAQPHAGGVFACRVDVAGLPEPPVRLAGA